MKVILQDCTINPYNNLYGAYRVCYSAKPPEDVWEDIKSNKTSQDKIKSFIEERLKTGHTSPLEQIVFTYSISGISRSLSHQLVRHRAGISFAQQSQRYVKLKEDDLFDFVTPESWRKAGMTEDFHDLMVHSNDLYLKACNAGVPPEDARFVLPNAACTNFQLTVNFAELLHIGDVRLCHQAQWEFRKLVSRMKSELSKVHPDLSDKIQPKCCLERVGYCDESLERWRECPIGKNRPHKTILFET